MRGRGAPISLTTCGGGCHRRRTHGAQPHGCQHGRVEHIRESGLDLAKWPGSVSVGSASAPAVEVDLPQLIERADALMYESRRAHRSLARRGGVRWGLFVGNP